MSTLHCLPRPRSHGPVVVCLHCSSSSGRQWRALTAPLAQQFDFRTPDLLGYDAPGNWPTGARVSLDDEADRLSELLVDAEAPVHLLGHSYGGAVALQMSLRWPGRVASMTLYEPVRFGLLFGASTAGAGEAAQTVEARYQIVTIGNRFALAVMSGRLDEAAAMFVDYWGGHGTWAAMDPRRRHLQAALMPKVNAEFQSLFSDRVPAPVYESLTMPVHLIGGTSSPLPARMVMRLLATRIPKISTVTVVGLNHMAPVSAADRVRAQLPDWLQPGESMPGLARAAELAAA